MKGILIYNQSLYSEKYQKQLDLYEEAAQKQGISLDFYANSSFVPSVVDGKSSFDVEISEYTFGLFLDKDTGLAKQLEKKGLTLYNSSDSIRLCDNKIETFLHLADKHYPLPDTMFSTVQFPLSSSASGRSGVNLDLVVDRLGLPVVLKEACGSYGEQVYLAENRAELEEISEKIGVKPHLFQKFVESSRGVDVRMYVVGEKICGGMKRVNHQDFRANLSSGGEILPYEPSKEVEELAISVTKDLGLTFSGVDILFDETGKPLLCEVNSSAHIKNYFDFFGHNLAEEIFGAIKGLKL